MHLLSEAGAAKRGAEFATLHMCQRTIVIRLREETKGSMLPVAGGVDERDSGRSEGRKNSTAAPILRCELSSLSFARKVCSGSGVRLPRGSKASCVHQCFRVIE